MAETPNKDKAKSDDASEQPKGKIGGFVKRHKALLWWAHSFYALGLGVMIILFAAKGFEHSQMLAATLGGAFLLILVIFRIFGQGQEQIANTEGKVKKVSFFVMTYVLKNLYQGMLFFVLPFYWKSSTLDSPNGWFVIVLGVFAIISTMDIIFDHILMRHKILAALFFGVTLFACVNLVIPALLPQVPTLLTLLVSGALAVIGFWLLHFPIKTLKEKRGWSLLTASVLVIVAILYFARIAMPPVPLYVVHAAVGPQVLADGRLALEVGRAHESLVDDLYCVSDVRFPGGQGDSLKHIWRFSGSDKEYVAKQTTAEKLDKFTVRLRSSFKGDELPKKPAGEWTVDIVTHNDQIIGRARFMVID